MQRFSTLQTSLLKLLQNGTFSVSMRYRISAGIIQHKLF